MKRIKSTLRFSIQHDKRKGTTSVAKTELLNKQFIWVSNSSAAVSVLFVQKSEGELWFCVNYCNLKWITKESLPSFINIWDSAEHQIKFNDTLS
jgi:hypothetical protein